MAPGTNLPYDYAANLIDALLVTSATLPTANNTTTLSTNVIQVGPANNNYPFAVQGKFYISLQASAAAGANNTNVNCWLQHSIDNNTSNFANIPELANPNLLQITDNNGAGSAAKQSNVFLPPTAKPFIRAQYKGEANGGASNNGTLTLALVFVQGM